MQVVTKKSVLRDSQSFPSFRRRSRGTKNLLVYTRRVFEPESLIRDWIHSPIKFRFLRAPHFLRGTPTLPARENNSLNGMLKEDLD